MKQAFIYLFIICLFIISEYSYGQEMLGASSGNYAGTNAMRLNPSSMVNSYLKWEVNIITAGAFFENNYLYLPNTNLLKLFKGEGLSGLNAMSSYYSGDNSNKLIQDYDNTRKKSAYLNMSIQGPSVIISKKDYSIGFHTTFRTAFSMRRLHYSIAKFSYEGLEYQDLQNTQFIIPDKTRINMMSWSEFGLSYGKTIKNTYYKTISAGATVKLLHGYGSAYLISNGMEYTVINDQYINITSLDAAYGYIDPYSYESGNGNVGYNNILKGSGVAFDIGITILRKKTRMETFGTGITKRNKSKMEDYQWRLGISLLDVGGISFKRDAKTFDFNNVAAAWNNIDSTAFSSITILDTMLSNEFYNDPLASAEAGSYKMKLPTAFSMQLDYHLAKRIYINATGVLIIPHKNPAIDRASLLAITPRFETKLFEVSIPVILYQMQYPRIGAAVRIGTVTIGSDNIGSIFIPNDFTGYDIYASIKIASFKGKKKPRYECPKHCKSK